ncbi:nuclear transport factor 2 family protein [Chitinophaga sp. 22321]|uniref:Nuclear transport factor 2 family protein n=1 Tax=Chitinophaga hostae TaxID=2831022 RepID=A0ABS5J9L2_9BACT|nr:nuclear transport factor 2 family protein [Chitinophaga hostae]MBS0031806.1 nuclear transport factor 2 family protein [Chitinophaga hostae]
MKNQILELEKKYWDGMKNHDFQTVKSLTYFPCLVAGKNGVLNVDEASYKKMFESGKDKQIEVEDISNVESQMINERTAIIAYLITLEYDGTSMSCACTSTWVKQNDSWLCAMHTESDLEKQTA